MAETLRLDKFLWFVRLTRSRSAAQAVAEGGHLRIDGRVVDRAHAAVRPGNVLSFPLHGRVRIIRVEALPRRRGSASEAAAHLCDLSPPPQPALHQPQEGSAARAIDAGEHRT